MCDIGCERDKNGNATLNNRRCTRGFEEWMRRSDDTTITDSVSIFVLSWHEWKLILRFHKRK